MPTSSSPKILGTLLLSLSLLGFARPAHAGFEWVAPAEAPAPTSAPVLQDQMMPAPVPQTPEVISPVIIEGGHTSGPAVPVPSAAPATVVSTAPEPALVMPAAPMPAPAPAAAPVPVAPAPVMANDAAPATTISTSPATAVPSGDVVHGFANNVPLSVALREILPAGYGFSLDPDVDMGTLVSFRGGKPWRETLKDALDPAGLGMHDKGQTIVIGHADTTPTPIATASSSPILGAPPRNLNAPMETVSVAPAPLPANVPMSSTVAPTVETWNAERGETLHKIIEQWSRRANVEFNWLAEYDYPIQASVSFTGTFEDAVRNILTGFETAHPQPVAELHANPNVNQMVLVVTTRGNNYSD